MDYKWYIANVVAGQENKVCNEIKNIIERNADNENFSIKNALVPIKMVTKIKNGKKVQDEQRLFPGYVFVNMCLENTDASTIIRSIPKVMGFLGSKSRPQVVPESKVQGIINKMENASVNESEEFHFEVGESVKIIQGPFESFTGIVEEADNEKKRLKLSVTIFGRTTSVDLDVSQVEKL